MKITDAGLTDEAIEQKIKKTIQNLKDAYKLNRTINDYHFYLILTSKINGYVSKNPKSV